MTARRGKALQATTGASAGSPSPDEPVYLVVGKLRRSHGVKGEIQVEPVTDSPERLKPGMVLYYGDNHIPITLKSRRPHGALLLLSFEDMEDIDSVSRLTNSLLFVRRDSLPPLPEGEYYHYQLIGLKVINEDGENLGNLEEILETGSNDVYLVRTPDSQELLLPAREEIIIKVDLESKEITARPPEWLD